MLSMLPCIDMAVLNFLSDSLINWQQLVSSQLLTGKKLNDDKRQRRGMAYGIKGVKFFSPVKIRTLL